MSQKSVKRNFSFPKDYDAKITKLMTQEGCSTKEELFRKSLVKLEEEAKR